MRTVTIVGAGIAGMSAALRLLERGWQVRLVEQDAFMGGMLRACHFPDETSGARHEHSYHMLMNWYVNTWALVDELGLRANFTPSAGFNFLRRGGGPMPQMLNVGSMSALLRNLTHGPAPLPDMFVFMYSMIDLLATPMHRDGFLDEISVNGFMASRPYSTERAALLNQRVWETVWAVPSYNASAKSYKNFLKYGNYAPTPQLWLFKGNKFDALIGPLEAKLKSYGERFEFMPLHFVTGLTLDANGRATALDVARLDHSPSIDARGWHKPALPAHANAKPLAIDGDLILALTPGGMARLVDEPVYQREPTLGNLRKLRSMPMAAIELYFKKGVFLKDLPADVCVLMDSPHQCTFLDYTQHWPDCDSTLLYVTVSDCDALMALPPERRRNAAVKSRAPGALVLDLERPTTAIEALLAELRLNLDFDPADIDLVRTRMQTNRGEDLFGNETGSEQWRPGTETRMANVFLGGTYTRNYADVATVEGAVVSGFAAAEAVRARAGVMPPIEIKAAGFHHESVFAALKLAWAPYAYAAKLWSMANDAYGTPGGNDLFAPLLQPWLDAIERIAADDDNNKAPTPP